MTEQCRQGNVVREHWVFQNQTRLGERHISHQRGTSLTRLLSPPAIMAASLPPVPGVTARVTRVIQHPSVWVSSSCTSYLKARFFYGWGQKVDNSLLLLKTLAKGYSSAPFNSWNLLIPSLLMELYEIYFQSLLRGISSLIYSSLEPQMMNQTSKWGGVFSIANICLLPISTVYSIYPQPSSESLYFSL